MLLLPPLGLGLGFEWRERKPTVPTGGRAGYKRGFQMTFPFAANPNFWHALSSSDPVGALGFLLFSTVALLLTWNLTLLLKVEQFLFAISSFSHFELCVKWEDEWAGQVSLWLGDRCLSPGSTGEAKFQHFGSYCRCLILVCLTDWFVSLLLECRYTGPLWTHSLMKPHD